MSKKNLITVSGLIGSGKDTVAAYLVEHYGFKRVSFSAVLKDMVHTVFGFDREMLEGVTVEARTVREQRDEWWSRKLERDVSPRSILQEIGTRVMRDNFDNNIWVLALQRRIEMAGGDKLVASDARFFNELAMFRLMGGTNLRVVRGQPIWTLEFYTEVASQVAQLLNTPLQDCDLSNPVLAAAVRKIAMEIAQDRSFQVHSSEWEHTLWNKFITIDNSGSLQNLYKQIDEMMV